MAGKLKAIGAEADQIFTKNRKDLADANGNFQKIDKNTNPTYRKEYERTYNQVRDTRLNQWK